MRTSFTNRAINEYRSLYSPAYADHLIDSIVANIERLKSFPEMGRRVPEFDLSYLRELIHNDYRIVYKIARSTSSRFNIVRGI